MAKYRRKGKIVEADWHPAGLVHPVLGHVLSPCYTTKKSDGTLLVCSKETFESECEAVDGCRT